MNGRNLIRVVDDDEGEREAITYLVESMGWKAVSYSSAKEFLINDEPSRTGCLILDIRMPEMSGLELQDEMIRRGYLLPIIFLTAHGDVETAVDAVRKGAINFLLKPIEQNKFFEAIDEALSRSLHWVLGQVSIQEQQVLYGRLSERKKQIVHLVAKGLTNNQIANRIGISQRTVEGHRAQAFKTLNLETVEELKQFLKAIEEYKEKIGL